MDIVVGTYTVYILLSMVLTVWVARTLHKNGRVFLVEVFHGDEQIADSVNHLLVVGFYLINLGYITLALKIGYELHTLREAFEALSWKIGLVLLVLGGCTSLIFSFLTAFIAAPDASIINRPRQALLAARHI